MLFIKYNNFHVFVLRGDQIWTFLWILTLVKQISMDLEFCYILYLYIYWSPLIYAYPKVISWLWQTKILLLYIVPNLSDSTYLHEGYTLDFLFYINKTTSSYLTSVQLLVVHWRLYMSSQFKLDHRRRSHSSRT